MALGNEFPPSRKPVSSNGGNPTPPSDKRDRNIRNGLLVGGILIFVLLIFAFFLSVYGGGQNQLVQVLGIEGDIQGILSKVVNIIFGIADISAVIATVIGVFVYLAALGDPKELKRGKKILLFSIISLVLISFAWLLTISLLNAEPGNNPAEGTGREIITSPSPAQCPAPCMISFDISGIPESGYFFDWDFGDASKGTGKVVSHEYAKQGLKAVSVKIIDSESNEVDLLRTNVLVDNALPKPKMIADPIAGRAPLKVDFDASESSDDDGVTKYEWDFGDPTYAAEGNGNTASGVKAIHTFSKDGTYTVTLTVSDTNNNQQSAQQTIEVGQAPDIPTAIISTTPPLDTTTDPASLKGTSPLRISFSAGKSRDSDGTIVEYVWDFGDGSPSEKSKTATHTYEELGTYDASLTVIDNDQKEDTQTIQVMVIEPPKLPTAVITSKPIPDEKGIVRGDAPFTLELDGIKSKDPDGNVVDYRWSFGDDSPIATGQTTSYIYKKAGTYTLSLIAVDNDDLESEPATITVLITAPGPVTPIASFSTTPEPATGNVPFTVNFDAAASNDPDGNIISYEWNFGDGKNLLGSSQVSHLFSSPGIYTVTLTVHDDEGLTGEYSKPIAAHLPKPIAAISVNKDSGAVPLAVHFNASNSTGNITNYNWAFGDGTVDQGREVNHTYTASGTYTVTLTVKDTTEQIDTASINITAQ